MRTGSCDAPSDPIASNHQKLVDVPEADARVRRHAQPDEEPDGFSVRHHLDPLGAAEAMHECQPRRAGRARCCCHQRRMRRVVALIRDDHKVRDTEMYVIPEPITDVRSLALDGEHDHKRVGHTRGARLLARCDAELPRRVRRLGELVAAPCEEEALACVAVMHERCAPSQPGAPLRTLLLGLAVQRAVADRHRARGEVGHAARGKAGVRA
eukprot:5049089-Prymnesium_polylepis.1